MRASILAVLFAALVMGCANIPQELNPKVYYRHDMTLTVNNKRYAGVAVAPRQEGYLVQITSKADMDLLQITSCQRDITVESAIEQGWIKKKRTYSFEYRPTQIERESGCILKMAGYEKVNGRHSWAFIDFEDPKFLLPAKLACNGEPEYQANGVSICQSLEGLIQLIYFAVPVVLSDKVMDRCKIPLAPDGMRWKFKAPNRECAYLFMEKVAPYRRHRLTTVGYESVPIRGE